MKPFKILKTETLINVPFCHIVEETVELPNKEEAKWYCHQTPDAVIIIPQTAEGKYVLQRNYKHGSRKIITEFCAGMIDEGESPETAAKRELLEETGYTATNWIKLGESYASPTSTAMKYHYFLAVDTQKTQDPELEAAEQIETFEVPHKALLFKTLSENNSSAASFAAFGLIQ